MKPAKWMMNKHQIKSIIISVLFIVAATAGAMYRVDLWPLLLDCPCPVSVLSRSQLQRIDHSQSDTRQTRNEIRQRERSLERTKY